MSSPEVLDLEELEGVEALSRDWLDLAARIEVSSYFQTPDWVLAWWDTIAKRPRTRLAAWRSPSGRLEAIVALSRGRERLHRRLPFAVPVHANAGSGAGDADHCAWLVPAERGAEVAAWLTEATRGVPLLARAAAPDWPPESLPAGARVVDTAACPQVALPLETGPGGPSSGFVRQLRRFTRRLEREGVSFEWVPPSHVDDRLLPALFELHGRGRQDGPGSFDAGQLDLHRRLVASAEAGRGPAAVVARREDEIAGVLYGFWWRQTFAAYQSGWDRAYARHGLGNVLILHALEFAAGHGATTFDFLRGTEPYKYRFGAQDRWDRTWLVPRGPAGALLVARHRARARRGPRTRRTDPPAGSPRE